MFNGLQKINGGANEWIVDEDILGENACQTYPRLKTIQVSN